MSSKEFVIRVGDPKSDGNILLCGFGFPSPKGRWMGAEASLLLPFPAKEIRSFRLLAFAEKEQELKVYHEGRLLKVETFQAGEEREVVVPFEAEGEEKPRLDLKAKFYESKWDYRSLLISQIVVELSEEVEWVKEAPPAGPEEAYRRQVEKLGRGYEGLKVFFGDLHIHSNLSKCDYPYSGSPEENLRYARDLKGHDFAALADHAEDMSEEEWRELNHLLDEFNEEGRFVTIPAFEWSSCFYGHRNVYYLRSGRPKFSCTHPRSDTPAKLYRAVREAAGEEAVVIPHHPAKIMFPLNWDYHDPELERCVEICSKWGSSEHYRNPLQLADEPGTPYGTFPGLFVQDALARGYRLGFVGGSDGHVLKPGSRGLTGIWAPELSREALFDALRKRRTFATTGARIQILFSLNGHPMGEEIKVNRYQLEALYPFEIYVEVLAESPLERVELVENNQVVFSATWAFAGGFYAQRLVERGVEEPEVKRHINFVWKPPAHPCIHFSRFYYVRAIQADGHMAWSSPIWVTLVES